MITNEMLTDLLLCLTPEGREDFKRERGNVEPSSLGWLANRTTGLLNVTAGATTDAAFGFILKRAESWESYIHSPRNRFPISRRFMYALRMAVPTAWTELNTIRDAFRSGDLSNLGLDPNYLLTELIPNTRYIFNDTKIKNILIREILFRNLKPNLHLSDTDLDIQIDHIIEHIDNDIRIDDDMRAFIKKINQFNLQNDNLYKHFFLAVLYLTVQSNELRIAVHRLIESINIQEIDSLLPIIGLMLSKHNPNQTHIKINQLFLFLENNPNLIDLLSKGPQELGPILQYLLTTTLGSDLGFTDRTIPGMINVIMTSLPTILKPENYPIIKKIIYYSMSDPMDIHQMVHQFAILMAKEPDLRELLEALVNDITPFIQESIIQYNVRSCRSLSKLGMDGVLNNPTFGNFICELLQQVLSQQKLFEENRPILDDLVASCMPFDQTELLKTLSNLKQTMPDFYRQITRSDAFRTFIVYIIPIISENHGVRINGTLLNQLIEHDEYQILDHFIDSYKDARTSLSFMNHYASSLSIQDLEDCYTCDEAVSELSSNLNRMALLGYLSSITSIKSDVPLASVLPYLKAIQQGHLSEELVVLTPYERYLMSTKDVNSQREIDRLFEMKEQDTDTFNNWISVVTDSHILGLISLVQQGQIQDIDSISEETMKSNPFLLDLFKKSGGNIVKTKATLTSKRNDHLASINQIITFLGGVSVSRVTVARTEAFVENIRVASHYNTSPIEIYQKVQDQLPTMTPPSTNLQPDPNRTTELLANIVFCDAKEPVDQIDLLKEAPTRVAIHELTRNRTLIHSTLQLLQNGGNIELSDLFDPESSIFKIMISLEGYVTNIKELMHPTIGQDEDMKNWLDPLLDLTQSQFPWRSMRAYVAGQDDVDTLYHGYKDYVIEAMSLIFTGPRVSTTATLMESFGLIGYINKSLVPFQAAPKHINHTEVIRQLEDLAPYKILDEMTTILENGQLTREDGLLQILTQDLSAISDSPLLQETDLDGIKTIKKPQLVSIISTKLGLPDNVQASFGALLENIDYSQIKTDALINLLHLVFNQQLRTGFGAKPANNPNEDLKLLIKSLFEFLSDNDELRQSIIDHRDHIKVVLAYYLNTTFGHDYAFNDYTTPLFMEVIMTILPSIINPENTSIITSIVYHAMSQPMDLHQLIHQVGALLTKEPSLREQLLAKSYDMLPFIQESIIQYNERSCQSLSKLGMSGVFGDPVFEIFIMHVLKQALKQPKLFEENRSILDGIVASCMPFDQTELLKALSTFKNTIPETYDGIITSTEFSMFIKYLIPIISKEYGVKINGLLLSQILSDNDYQVLNEFIDRYHLSTTPLSLLDQNASSSSYPELEDCITCDDAVSKLPNNELRRYLSSITNIKSDIPLASVLPYLKAIQQGHLSAELALLNAHERNLISTNNQKCLEQINRLYALKTQNDRLFDTLTLLSRNPDTLGLIVLITKDMSTISKEQLHQRINELRHGDFAAYPFLRGTYQKNNQDIEKSKQSLINIITTALGGQHANGDNKHPERFQSMMEAIEFISQQNNHHITEDASNLEQNIHTVCSYHINPIQVLVQASQAILASLTPQHSSSYTPASYDLEELNKLSQLIKDNTSLPSSAMYIGFNPDITASLLSKMRIIDAQAPVEATPFIDENMMAINGILENTQAYDLFKWASTWHLHHRNIDITELADPDSNLFKASKSLIGLLVENQKDFIQIIKQQLSSETLSDYIARIITALPPINPLLDEYQKAVRSHNKDAKDKCKNHLIHVAIDLAEIIFSDKDALAQMLVKILKPADSESDQELPYEELAQQLCELEPHEMIRENIKSMTELTNDSSQPQFDPKTCLIDGQLPKITKLLTTKLDAVIPFLDFFNIELPIPVRDSLKNLLEKTTVLERKENWIKTALNDQGAEWVRLLGSILNVKNMSQLPMFSNDYDDEMDLSQAENNLSSAKLDLIFHIMAQLNCEEYDSFEKLRYERDQDLDDLMDQCIDVIHRVQPDPKEHLRPYRTIPQCFEHIELNNDRMLTELINKVDACNGQKEYLEFRELYIRNNPNHESHHLCVAFALRGMETPDSMVSTFLSFIDNYQELFDALASSNSTVATVFDTLNKCSSHDEFSSSLIEMLTDWGINKQDGVDLSIDLNKISSALNTIMNNGGSDEKSKEKQFDANEIEKQFLALADILHVPEVQEIDKDSHKDSDVSYESEYDDDDELIEAIKGLKPVMFEFRLSNDEAKRIRKDLRTIKRRYPKVASNYESIKKACSIDLEQSRDDILEKIDGALSEIDTKWGGKSINDMREKIMEIRQQIANPNQRDDLSDCKDRLSEVIEEIPRNVVYAEYNAPALTDKTAQETFLRLKQYKSKNKKQKRRLNRINSNKEVQNRYIFNERVLTRIPHNNHQRIELLLKRIRPLVCNDKLLSLIWGMYSSTGFDYRKPDIQHTYNEDLLQGYGFKDETATKVLAMLHGKQEIDEKEADIDDSRVDLNYWEHHTIDENSDSGSHEDELQSWVKWQINKKIETLLKITFEECEDDPESMIKLIGLTKKFLYSQDSHHVIFENSEDITDFISRIYFRSQKTEKLGIEDDVSFGTLIEFMHVELQLEKSIRNRDGTSYDDIQSIIDDIERLNKKDLKSIFMIVTKYLLFKKGVRDLRNCRWTFGLYMIIQFIKSFFIWCVEKCVDAFILTKDLGRNLKHSLFGSARDSDVIDKNDHSLGIGNST